MGTFTVTVKVHNPNDASRSDDIDLMVDTGSSYTHLPTNLLQRLGISTPRERKIELANGSIVIHRVGEAVITYKDESWVCPVAGIEQGRPVLGAITLEILGLSVDPVKGQLIPTTYQLAPRISAVD